MLFDFCVHHSPMSGSGDSEDSIGFTSFSKVFSPDTFHMVKTLRTKKNTATTGTAAASGSGVGSGENYSKDQQYIYSRNILPADPDTLPPKRPILNMNAAPETNVQDAYIIGTHAMERMVRNDDWSDCVTV